MMEDNNSLVLLSNVSHMIKSHIKRKIDKLGIPFAYRPFMYHLNETNGLSQVELVEKTGFKPPTVSLTIKKMEHDGLVNIVVCKDDSRKTLIYLTPKGKKNNEEVNETYLEACKEISSILENDEKEILEKILEKMFDYLKKDKKDENI